MISRRQIMASERRVHSKEFKTQVVREVEAGKPIAQAAREYQIHPTQITRWRARLAAYPQTAFSGNGNAYTSEARIAELERLIGQLTIENAALKKTCSRLEAKARLLIVSGKR